MGAFIIGLLVGGFIGMAVMACCASAKDGDRIMRGHDGKPEA